ncbi:gliding motility protein [Streptomyces sp. NPDC001728]|uniref:gliding motility protein n=1 Tax=Streptomyces sp. NPDC001728 TaxID=3154396 RepID=UPI00331F3A44
MFRRKNADTSPEGGEAVTATEEAVTEVADVDVTDEVVAESAPVAAGTVDIPKQQSAEAAADSEAGEGASK